MHTFLRPCALTQQCCVALCCAPTCLQLMARLHALAAELLLLLPGMHPCPRHDPCGSMAHGTLLCRHNHDLHLPMRVRQLRLDGGPSGRMACTQRNAGLHKTHIRPASACLSKMRMRPPLAFPRCAALGPSFLFGAESRPFPYPS